MRVGRIARLVDDLSLALAAALLSGQADFILDPPPQDVARLESNKDTKVIRGQENRIIFFGFDQFRDELLYSSVKGRNPFKDLRVRQAVYHAIDIEAIRTRTMRGSALPTGGITPGRAERQQELDDLIIQESGQAGPEKFAQWILDEKRLLITDTTFRDAHRPNLAEGEQDRLCATALQELRDRVARLHAKLEKEPDLCEILLDVLRTPSNVGGGRSPGVHGHRAPWRTPESLAVILAAHVLDLDATRIRRRVRFNPKDQEGRKMKNHIVVGRFQEDEQD